MAVSSEVHAGFGGGATPIQPAVRASPPPQLDLLTSTSLLLPPTTPFWAFHARRTEACRRPAYARRAGYSPGTAGDATFDAPFRAMTHYFQIGGSLSRSLAGTAVDKVTKIGRWKMEAVARYYIGVAASSALAAASKAKARWCL